MNAKTAPAPTPAKVPDKTTHINVSEIPNGEKIVVDPGQNYALPRYFTVANR